MTLGVNPRLKITTFNTPPKRPPAMSQELCGNPPSAAEDSSKSLPDNRAHIRSARSSVLEQLVGVLQRSETVECNVRELDATGDAMRNRCYEVAGCIQAALQADESAEHVGIPLDDTTREGRDALSILRNDVSRAVEIAGYISRRAEELSEAAVVLEQMLKSYREMRQ